MRIIIILLLPILAFGSSVDDIVSTVTKTKSDLIEFNKKNGLREENLFFLMIMNHDDTILHGNSTMGLVDGDGKVVYKGLAQVAIESGLSKQYSPNGYAQFVQNYNQLELTSHPQGWTSAAQMLAGAKPEAVLKLSQDYFKSTLKNYFFQDSLDLIQKIKKAGVQVRIITASPQLFVQGAGPSLGIPTEHIYGMESVIVNGLITDQMVMPLTTAQGKVDKIQQIVQGILSSNSRIKKVYVVSGFGNNNGNDIVFLKWIAAQTLPIGRPISIIGFERPAVSRNFDTLLLD